MEKLSYSLLERQGYEGYLLKDAPERVLQFGEGAFLRAFAEDFIDQMNEKAGFNAKAVLVQPRGGHPDTCARFTEQDGLYTLLLRGREKGEAVSRKRIISCVSRCLDPKGDWQSVLDCAKNPDLRFIISNTTEAGIVFDPACKAEDAPPASFPGKLTLLLHERWRLGLPGFIILACELSEHNGEELLRCVKEYIGLWGLEPEFLAWAEGENLFCSTVVDRIVTGRPKEDASALCRELGYQDDLPDTGEVFASWIIEGPQSIKAELPFEKAGLPIRVVDDHVPYKQRKVRILNGAHTGFVPAAHLVGFKIVRDCMEDPVVRGFMNRLLYDEVIPTLSLDRKDLEDFAASVADRFNNPYIDHALLSIALNSTSKWKARVMPSLLDSVANTGKLPPCITFSFAAYIAFYRDCPAQDDPWVLEFYQAHQGNSPAQLARAVIRSERMWGGELAALDGFEEAVTDALERIGRLGAYEAMKECLA
jgi:tagaturonate reductase